MDKKILCILAYEETKKLIEPITNIRRHKFIVFLFEQKIIPINGGST